MNKNILWLVSWYPNALSPYDGDFIQRHAAAVALRQKVTVIYIKKDDRGSITRHVKIFSSTQNNLHEIIVFYYSVKTRFQFLNKILSALKYKKVYRKVLQKHISKNGKPTLIHVHVALKAGLQALWLKRKFNIPFIISEHWTGYLNEANYSVKDLGIIKRTLLQKIFSNASKVTVVSDVLGKAISSHFKIEKYVIVPNVVDTTIFFYEEKAKTKRVNLVHVSSLKYQKNISAIFEALSLIKKRNYDFRVLIFGTVHKELKTLITSKSLDGFVEFKNEVSQTQLAAYFKISDALILYSLYETFGCVVIEANACGVPAILSDLPVFHEYVTENENGIFVSPNDPLALADTIENFILSQYHFNNKMIAEKATAQFNYDVVAAKFCGIYENVLTS